MNQLTVMLIDDECMAIEYMRDLIYWEQAGFKIVAEVTNTSEVMADFRKTRPQIVISDIRMPGVNGLDLCREMLAIDKSVKIILLTAYSEFEYAKKAISLGVSGYILKHELDEKRLLEELNKAKESIDKENTTSEIVNKYVFMNSIGEFGRNNESSDPQWNIMKANAKTLILLLLKEDRPYSVFSEDNGETREVANIDILESDIYADLSDGYSYIDYFILNNGIIVVLFSHHDYLTDDFFKSTFYPVSNQSRKKLSEMTGRSFSSVVVMGRYKLDNISKMYHSSVGIFDYLPFWGAGRNIFACDVAKPVLTDHLKQEAADRIQRIRLNLGKPDTEKAVTEKVVQEISTLFGVIIRAGSPELLKFCCEELKKVLTSWQEKNFLPPFCLPEPCYTAVQLRDCLTGLLEHHAWNADPDIATYSRKIYDAVQYLHLHFAEDISVAMVADELEISESNLSKSFKNETGKSVLDYLTDVRITESKKLLKNTNCKVYRISEMVGYKTSQYFSQVFFKATGMHPLEYREKPAGENNVLPQEIQ